MVKKERTAIDELWRVAKVFSEHLQIWVAPTVLAKCMPEAVSLVSSVA